MELYASVEEQMIICLEMERFICIARRGSKTRYPITFERREDLAEDLEKFQ